MNAEVIGYMFPGWLTVTSTQGPVVTSQYCLPSMEKPLDFPAGSPPIPSPIWDTTTFCKTGDCLVAFCG